jgi:hypothetical protein
MRHVSSVDTSVDALRSWLPALVGVMGVVYGVTAISRARHLAPYGWFHCLRSMWAVSRSCSLAAGCTGTGLSALFASVHRNPSCWQASFRVNRCGLASRRSRRATRLATPSARSIDPH